MRCKIYAQNLRKILSQCAIYAQDCTYFSHSHCARFAQDCTFLQCAIYAQHLHKIALISRMRNICARLYLLLICRMRNICVRFAQDCTYFPNAHHIYAQDCRHYWKKYVTYHISALNLEWYSLHCYFWIATSFDFFLNKHL